MLSMAHSEIVVRIRLENPKALKALKVAAQNVESLLEDFPYRPEIKEAAKALRYACKHLTVE
jgi:CYTH domain-containing protein